MQSVLHANVRGSCHAQNCKSINFVHGNTSSLRFVEGSDSKLSIWLLIMFSNASCYAIFCPTHYVAIVAYMFLRVRYTFGCKSNT